MQPTARLTINKKPASISACGFFAKDQMLGYYEQMIWVSAPVQRRKMIVMPWFVKIGSGA
jgi:hypothetical protein